MKRVLGLVVGILLISVNGYAGNVDAVTSQSAQVVRAPSRAASTDVDAAYYNPSGLAKLTDGFYWEFTNLTLLKNDTLITGGQTYTAENPVLLFPTLAFVYKSGSLAGYLSVHIPGGGGSVHYYGHPLFNGSEPLVAAAGAEQSDFIDGAVIKDSEVVGKSIYLGASFGVVYDISGLFSLSLGARVVSASNHYQANVTYGLTSSALGREATSVTLRVDAEQKALGFGAIAGLSFYPIDDLILSLKYESTTALEFTNETHTDDINYFPDGEKNQRDMPALATAGMSWKLLDDITIDVGYTYYFTTSADWGEDEEGKPIAESFRDGWDASGAILYHFTPDFGVSMGALRTINAHNKDTRSALSFGSNSWMYGGGIVYLPQEDLEFNVGISEVLYDERKNADKSITFQQHKYIFGFGIAARL